MVQLQYFNGMKWVNCGDPWFTEHLAWLSLGGDDKDYRTIEVSSGKVLTEK